MNAIFLFKERLLRTRLGLSIFIILSILAMSGEHAYSQQGLPAFAVINTPPSSIDLYTSPPANIIAGSNGGPYLSFSGLPGHVTGDSERTSFYVKAQSQTNPTIEETAQDIEINDTTGLALNWINSQAYPANAYVHNGPNIYQNSTSCVSASAGSGPSGTGTGISDGTCTWAYAGVTNGDGKSASLLSGVIGPNGGHLWGQAIDVVANGGSMGGSLPGGFMVGQEIDISNFAKDCPVGQTGGCFVSNLFLNGSTLFKGTAGIIGGGQPSGNALVHQGVILLPYFASDVAFNDSTNASIGFASNGTHANYTFQDSSTSPTSIYISGSHSFAGVLDNVSQVAYFSGGTHGGAAFQDLSTSPVSVFVQGSHTTSGIYEGSTSPIAINIAGNYSQYQIKGSNFSVDNAGNTSSATEKLTAVSISSLPSCYSGKKGLLAYVSDTVAAAGSVTWHGSVVAGGSTSVNSLVSCNGGNWQYE